MEGKQSYVISFRDNAYTQVVVAYYLKTVQNNDLDHVIKLYTDYSEITFNNVDKVEVLDMGKHVADNDYIES